MAVRPSRQRLSIAIGILLIPGLTDAQHGSASEGATPAEVRARLGLPAEVVSVGASHSTVEWRYHTPESDFAITFHDGVVSERSSTTPVEPPSLPRIDGWRRAGEEQFTSSRPTELLISTTRVPETKDPNALYGTARALTLQEQVLDALLVLERCVAVAPDNHACLRLLEGTRIEYQQRLVDALGGLPTEDLYSRERSRIRC